jgi:hypothetical protein
MTGNKHLEQGKAAIEVIEEGVHLLRLSPPSLLSSYYIGSLPFVLGVLFFWTDMSRRALADGYCEAASFGLAILFVWMKCWQAVFARQLKAQLSGEPATRWTVSRIARLTAVQTIIQPTGLFVLPAALIIALPFGWVYAFYQNVSVQADDGLEHLRGAVKKSWQLAKLWPIQNHILLMILFIFGGFIFVDLAVSIFWVPRLVKSLLGIESPFTRSVGGTLNTSFVAITCGIAYLCLDPLVKAVYVLRWFYGLSLCTGEDLRSKLKTLLPLKRGFAVSMIFLLGYPLSSTPMALENRKKPCLAFPSSPPSVSSEALDRSIRQVINRREYTWRMPREKVPRNNRDERGVFSRFFAWVAGTLRDMGRIILGGLEKLLAWLGNLLPTVEPGKKPSGKGWMGSVRTLVLILVGGLIGTLAVVLWRIRRRQRGGPQQGISEVISPMPDLSDDGVGADAVPVDRWLVMARELMEKGELRLALRALYLASLAHLSDHELITIARYKSNCDYRVELQRRAHGHLDLLTIFSEHVAMFDRAWYGLHEVTDEAMRRFAANHERMRACIEE